MKILIGADPELFVRNPESGQFISGHPYLYGTKENPEKCLYGALQVDGLALEFNIDPANTAEEFIHNVNRVKQQLQERVPHLQLVATPFAEFDQGYFMTLPDEVKVLGCTPDYNAYTRAPNATPDGNFNYRTASGHIHIGWTEERQPFEDGHYADCCGLSQQLDYYLGIYSLLWDPDNRRRSMYGKAGAFRPKPYGVEYRVLSNEWLNSDLLGAWVYRNAVLGTRNYFDGHRMAETFGDLAQAIIDENIIDWQDRFPDLAGALSAHTINPPKLRKVA